MSNRNFVGRGKARPEKYRGAGLSSATKVDIDMFPSTRHCQKGLKMEKGKSGILVWIIISLLIIVGISLSYYF